MSRHLLLTGLALGACNHTEHYAQKHLALSLMLWSWYLSPWKCYLIRRGYNGHSYVWIWELDYKESWAMTNWCFLTAVLEKTLKSPLDCKEIQPVCSEGDQAWILTGRTDTEAEAPILCPPDVKNWLLGKDPDVGKDWRQEEKGTTKDEMIGWHHDTMDMSLSKVRELVMDREA